MNQNIKAIQFVEKLTDRMQVNAIKRHASIIQYFQFPCREAQMLAIEQDFTLIKTIKRPLAEVIHRASVLQKDAENNAKINLAQTNGKKRWKNLSYDERIELMTKRNKVQRVT